MNSITSNALTLNNLFNQARKTSFEDCHSLALSLVNARSKASKFELVSVDKAKKQAIRQAKKQAAIDAK